MASKKTTKEEKVNFKEFKYSGKVFEYTGRVYEKQEGKGKVVSRTVLTLCLNDMITIKGLHLIETDDSWFIDWPSYKSGDSYKSYFFINKDLNDEIDKLTDAIVKLL
jgi:DNA-binding cell septation regulator SpoVG